MLSSCFFRPPCEAFWLTCLHFIHLLITFFPPLALDIICQPLLSKVLYKYSLSIVTCFISTTMDRTRFFYKKFHKCNSLSSYKVNFNRCYITWIYKTPEYLWILNQWFSDILKHKQFHFFSLTTTLLPSWKSLILIINECQHWSLSVQWQVKGRPRDQYIPTTRDTFYQN